MSPTQFMALVTGGMDRMSMGSFKVILIRGFEALSDSQSKSFVRAIRLFRAFQFGMGVRVILVSRRDFSMELHRIHECMPVIMDERAAEGDPEDVDLRVHSLVEIASKVAETPIRRLTERAAQFLEESVISSEGEELVLLLVEGMRRSRGSVLRLRDILPNFAHYFGPDDELESYCN